MGANSFWPARSSISFSNLYERLSGRHKGSVLLAVSGRHFSLLSNCQGSFVPFTTGFQQVFQRLFEKGVKLKPSKCHLFKQEVRYLGHLATGKGYTMDPEDKRAVLELKERRPASIGEIRKLLGFLRFYRKHAVHKFCTTW